MSVTSSTIASKLHAEKSEAIIAQQIYDINIQIAQFRDLLISIGQSRDCPENREKIRKLRRSCVQSCKSTSQMILPLMKSEAESGTSGDNSNLVLLFSLAQLFLQELYRSENLIRIVPMDMTGYFESKAGPSNIGNVITQFFLCKQITLDFNEEELCSIQKDSEEICTIMEELQEFMPLFESENDKLSTHKTSTQLHHHDGARKSFKWENRSRHPSYFSNSVNFLCCTAKPNYI